MTSELFIEIIHVLIAALAFASAILSFINRKKINKIEVSINGRIDQLLQTTKQQGKLEGREEMRRKNKKL